MELTEPDIAVFVNGDVWMERLRDRLSAKEETERKREAESDREREGGGGRFSNHACTGVFDVIQEVSSVTPSLRPSVLVKDRRRRDEGGPCLESQGFSTSVLRIVASLSKQPGSLLWLGEAHTTHTHIITHTAAMSE